MYHPGPTSPRRNAGQPVSAGAVIIALIFSTLLTATVWYIYYQKAFDGLLYNDAMDYAGIARNIAEGEGFISQYTTPLGLAHHEVPQPDLWRAPLWPLALAGFQKIFGFIDEASAIGTGFFFIASSPLIFLLARRWFNATVAAGSVLVYTFSPQMLHFSISGMTESMSVFFMVLVFLVLASPAANSRFGDLLLGMVVGLFYLTRYNALLFLPFIALLRYFQGERPRHKILLRIFLGFLLATSPWLIRNTLLFGNPLFSLQKYEPAMFTKSFPDYVMYILPEKIDVTGFILNNTAEILDKVNSNWQEFATIARTPEFWGFSPLLLILLLLPVFFMDRKISYQKLLIIFLFGSQLAALLVIHFIPRLFLIFTPLLIIIGLGTLWLFLTSIFPRRKTGLRTGRGWPGTRLRLHRNTLIVNTILTAAIAALAATNYSSIQFTAPAREKNLFPDAIAALSATTGQDDLILSNEGHIISWYGNRYAAKIPFSVEMIPEIDKLSPVKAIYISNRILWHMPEGDANWKELFYRHPPELYGFYLYRLFPDKGILYLKKTE